MKKLSNIFILMVVLPILMHAQYVGGYGSGDNALSFNNNYLSNWFFINGNWSVTSNWSDGVLPSSSENAYVTAMANVNGAYSYNSLIIAPIGSVTISAGNNITVTEPITIQSDAVGTGSLITSTSFTGNVERYLSGGIIGSLQGINHYVSMPVSAGTGSTLMDNSLGNFNVFTYTNNAFVRVFAGENIIIGKGYVVAYNANKTLNFSGTLNTGDYTSVPISKTNNDWNLIGNPYPCAITASSFVYENVTTNSNFLQGTIYFWNQTSAFNSGDYASHNGTGGTRSSNSLTVPDGNIATGQAFFVKSGVNASGGVCHFHDAMKTTTNTQFFIPDHASVQRFYLCVTDENNNYSEILVGFLEKATEAFDVLYDGEKLQGNPDLSVYSKISGDDNNFVIQGRPLINKSDIVSIGLFSSKAGKFTISQERLENFDENINIFLEDKKLQKIIDFRTQKDYSFYTTLGDINDRFVLHFNKMDVCIKNNKLNNNVIVYAKGRSIFINNPNMNNLLIQIYDILGKKIEERKLTGIGLNTIDFLGSKGYYLVKVIGENTNISKRVLVSY